MTRDYDNQQTLQQKIIKGANVLADNVASTLGPRGRNVLLKEQGKMPFITKDGVTVAAFVELEDPFENAAAQIIRQAATETNNTAGDGTTTATVLARAILNEAQKYVISGVSPIEIQRGIDKACKGLTQRLCALSRPVKKIQDIEHVARISANNDASIGQLISMAVDRIGQDGSITIEESRSLETSLDVTEGLKFDSGYAATAFITDERRAVMHYDEPMFFVTDHKITTVDQILPILEMIAREGRPLVIVAEDVDGQALAAIIMNAIRGTMKIAAIKAPFYGEERRNILADIATSTGANFITRESGKKLKEVTMSDFGSSKFIEANKYSTTIVGGNADYEQVEQRIETLKSLIADTDSLSECTRIQERIVRLSSGVAVIRVGGSTEVEMTERKHRIEDALEAVRSAQEEGIISGGGTALLYASQDLEVEVDNKEQELGVTIVKESCKAPFKQMAFNAGKSPDVLINEILQKKDVQWGWDFRSDRLTNLLEEGIIDPVKVTRTALQNAASCAGTLITTNFGIIQTG